MLHSILRLGVLCAAMISLTAVAATPAETIRQAFHKSRPDIQVENVRASDVKGLFEVRLKDGPTVYATEDGKFFFTGDLFQLAPGGFINIAERGREQLRKKRMAEVKTSDMIIFPAEGKTKGAVYVFTDVDCGYCRKLHNEVPDLNKLGIEVRYLAYPRDFPRGAQSRTTPKMVSAWCAEDQRLRFGKLGEHLLVLGLQGRLLHCRVLAFGPGFQLGDDHAGIGLQSRVQRAVAIDRQHVLHCLFRLQDLGLPLAFHALIRNTPLRILYERPAK